MEDNVIADGYGQVDGDRAEADSGVCVVCQQTLGTDTFSWPGCNNGLFLIETRQKNPYNSDKTLLAIGWIRLETNTCCTLLLDITPMSHSVDGLAMQQKMTSWCKNRGNSAPPTRKVPRL